jgi:hypothetical protein
MANQSYAGWESPIFIKKNLTCVQYADVVEASGYTLNCNGIVFVSAAHTTAAYKSFTAFIAAYPNATAIIVNMDTGEIRYYLGNPNTTYLDPEFDSIALCSHWEATIDRAVESIPEIGSPVPADIKQKTAKFNGKIDKMWSTRHRTAYSGTPEQPAAVAVGSKLKNPIGFTGWEAILDYLDPAQQGKDGYTPWFTVIAYVRDGSEAAWVRGLPVVFPCVKFGGGMTVKSDADGLCLQNISFEALRAIKAPRDVYQPYTYDLHVQP